MEERKKALEIQKILLATSKIEEVLCDLGLSEYEKKRVGTFFFGLRLELDSQLAPVPTAESLPEGFVPPKPTYEDLERSLELLEKQLLLARTDAWNMKKYWKYQ